MVYRCYDDKYMYVYMNGILLFKQNVWLVRDQPHVEEVIPVGGSSRAVQQYLKVDSHEYRNYQVFKKLPYN